MACHNVCMHVTAMAGDRITRVTCAVTKSRNLEEIEVRTCICTWLVLSKTKKRFHAQEKVPEQHFFSCATIFRRKNSLAGISRPTKKGSRTDPNRRLTHKKRTRLTHLLQACRAAPKPRVHSSPSYTDYRLMGCCSSTATVPEECQPASNVTDTVQVPIPVSPSPTLEQSSTNLSRPRSRTRSQQSPRRGTEISDTISPRRALSAPQVQSTNSPSSQHPLHSQEPRKRADMSARPSRCGRAGSRPPNPGEGDSWLGYKLKLSMTALEAHAKTGRRSLASTMRQVLSNHSRYVI